MLSGVLRSAVRDRLVAVSPCEGIRLPPRRRKDNDARIISIDALRRQLLPAIPAQHRALVALAGGTGLRWGECIGMQWEALDLDEMTARVVRVAVEVAGKVSIKPYPKSRAGRREVPIPPFVVTLLRERRQLGGARQYVFANDHGGFPGRGHFRSRVWRPAPVRAGLLGRVSQADGALWTATWGDETGAQFSAEFDTERAAVDAVARQAAGGLRFHDLRHSYATWLVSCGLPVNDVQRMVGHEHGSTTLELYTHRSG